eukprot:82363_1
MAVLLYSPHFRKRCILHSLVWSFLCVAFMCETINLAPKTQETLSVGSEEVTIALTPAASDVYFGLTLEFDSPIDYAALTVAKDSVILQTDTWVDSCLPLVVCLEAVGAPVVNQTGREASLCVAKPEHHSRRIVTSQTTPLLNKITFSLRAAKDTTVKVRATFVTTSEAQWSSTATHSVEFLQPAADRNISVAVTAASATVSFAAARKADGSECAECEYRVMLTALSGKAMQDVATLFAFDTPLQVIQTADAKLSDPEFAPGCQRTVARPAGIYALNVLARLPPTKDSAALLGNISLQTSFAPRPLRLNRSTAGRFLVAALGLFALGTALAACLCVGKMGGRRRERGGYALGANGPDDERSMQML